MKHSVLIVVIVSTTITTVLVLLLLLQVLDYYMPASRVQTSSSVGLGHTAPSTSDPDTASSQSSATLSAHEGLLS